MPQFFSLSSETIFFIEHIEVSIQSVFSFLIYIFNLETL